MKHKKRIAFVLNELQIGGVERALVTLLRHIDYDRYDVELWMYAIDGASVPQLDRRVKLRKIERPDPQTILLDDIRHGRLLRVFRGVFSRIMARIFCGNNILNLRYCTQCLPLCSNVRYDCVIDYQALARDLVATALYRFRGKRRICFVHGKNSFADVIKPFIRKELGKYHHICSVSQAVQTDFLKDFPSLERKCMVVHNIFDASAVLNLAAAPTDVTLQTPAIVTVGRLSREKGQDIIPKAARLLLDSGHRVYWYLVGDGNLLPSIENQIQIHSVQDHVILLGSRANPYPYMKNCAIYVQSSRLEGWGLTIQEAKLLKKPIVTTPAPAMYEQIVSGQNGLIADAITPEALAESIRTLLEHPELCTTFSNALKESHFDNEAELQKIYKCIDGR